MELEAALEIYILWHGDIHGDIYGDIYGNLMVI